MWIGSVGLPGGKKRHGELRPAQERRVCGLIGGCMMKGAKKTLVAVVLVLIIVGAVMLIVKTVRPSRTVELPDWKSGEKVERIDEKTFQIVTRTLGEWMKIERKNGRYMNPETGEFNMVEIVTCQACGERVPSPFSFPIDDPSKLGRMMAAHTCAKCGKPVVVVGRAQPYDPE